MKNLKWKLLTIVGVIVFAAAMIYPPFDTASRRGRISLGLDLKGGVQLVLRVKTDEALLYTSEDAAERLRLALREKNIAGPTITVPGPTRIVVAGVPQPMDAAFRALADAQPELVGAVHPHRRRRRLHLRAEAERSPRRCGPRPSSRRSRPSSAGSTRSVSSEPIVAPYGTAGDQILVQLPGVNDPDQVKRLIGTTALLELKIVEGGPAASQEALLQSTGGVVAARDGGRHRGRPDQPGLALLLPGAQGGAGHRPRPQQRPRLGRREQPAGGRLLDEPGRGRQVRQPHRREHRQADGGDPRRPGRDGGHHPGPDHRQRPDLRQLHRRRTSPTCR